MCVFAIETKGRSKPLDAKGKVQWRVQYDGQSLVFPSWRETKPLKQARDQAKWLAQWLTKATGEPITTYPVLVLPGWYVERSARGDLLVFDGRAPEMVFPRLGNDQTLAPEQIRRFTKSISAVEM